MPVYKHRIPLLVTACAFLQMSVLLPTTLTNADEDSHDSKTPPPQNMLALAQKPPF
jgi:hypothetical protein